MDRACSMYGATRGINGVLVEKIEGKRPLRRHTRRRDYNIKAGFQ